jgi:hypothetical protein
LVGSFGAYALPPMSVKLEAVKSAKFRNMLELTIVAGD